MTCIRFSVPPFSLDCWDDRLKTKGIQPQHIETEFGEQVLRFTDPDGIELQIVAAESDSRPGSSHIEIAQQNAIRGLHSVQLTESADNPERQTLMALLGFRRHRSQGQTSRAPGTLVDIHMQPGAPRGRMGIGAVHHVACRVETAGAQHRLRHMLSESAFSVTEALDRTFFRSIYFREPGGVLFEVATTGPGFAIDDPVDAPGRRLMLPPWLEPHRSEITRRSPPIDTFSRRGPRSPSYSLAMRLPTSGDGLVGSPVSRLRPSRHASYPQSRPCAISPPIDVHTLHDAMRILFPSHLFSEDTFN